MQLYEFQAKKVLSQYSIATPEGLLASNANEAEAAASRLGPGTLYVKAQSLAGDRMAAGGVRMVQSASLAGAAAGELLSRTLVTSQTGPRGETVRNVLVERGVDAAREFYLALSVDPVSASITLTITPNGGTGIELQSADWATLSLGINGERRAGDLAAFCRQFDIAPEAAQGLQTIIERVHRALIDFDAGLIEINPLVLTKSGEWIAVDAKVDVDANAAFRHPEFRAFAEQVETDQVELKAQQHQINYIQMDGNIGTVVNGAGLGLATLDMIRAAGGAPANFMDIRTTAKSMDIAQGISLVLDNPRAKVLLVNVFGGGMQPCDTIVEGLGIAFRRHPRRLPIVLRITGNNEELARQRLANFDIPKIECADMWQAVTRAVATAQGRA